MAQLGKSGVHLYGQAFTKLKIGSFYVSSDLSAMGTAFSLVSKIYWAFQILSVSRSRLSTVYILEDFSIWHRSFNSGRAISYLEEDY